MATIEMKRGTESARWQRRLLPGSMVDGPGDISTELHLSVATVRIPTPSRSAKLAFAVSHNSCR
ncbi:MAG TPA: hypothetical protein VHZ54_13775 [Solirubrobacterales bacterium]|nr:hypothetical protein [Solirubrobacterales bacterium]